MKTGTTGTTARMAGSKFYGALIKTSLIETRTSSANWGRSRVGTCKGAQDGQGKGYWAQGATSQSSEVAPLPVGGEANVVDGTAKEHLATGTQRAIAEETTTRKGRDIGDEWLALTRQRDGWLDGKYGRVQAADLKQRGMFRKSTTVYWPVESRRRR